jgi:DNA-binding beta-propeller fold protein YncE
MKMKSTRSTALFFLAAALMAAPVLADSPQDNGYGSNGTSAVTSTAAASGPTLTVQANGRKGFLETIHRHITLDSTIPDNGDVNPYAVVVAPVSAGTIEKGDVLIDNFNAITNLQGTGTSIMDYRPSTKKMTLFAVLPKKVPQCPVGVGLTTAMTMLKSGWIIVGSLPSTDGTTATKGDGCLFVLDPNGHLVSVWSGPTINGPWGDMAVIDHGNSAELFISMAGFDIPSPNVVDAKTGYPPILHQSTVLRIKLSIPPGQPPQLVDQTVIGSGFSQRADRDNFLFGPTGLVLSPDEKTLYVTDGLDNLIAAIPDPATRTDSAGTGQVVTQNGLLAWPLAMVMTPEGHLLVCNGKDGKAVEVDPASGQQIYAQWIDPDQAQSPPGNGDLFGLALTPDGKAFYYVQDDTNTLMEAIP